MRRLRGGALARPTELGANLADVMVWWPSLALLWWAVVPNAGVGSVVSIGLGLALLGLADTAAQLWGLRRRARSASAAEPADSSADHAQPAGVATPVAG